MGRQKFKRVVTFLTIVLILISSNLMQVEAIPVFDANPMVESRPLLHQHQPYFSAPLPILILVRILQ